MTEQLDIILKVEEGFSTVLSVCWCLMRMRYFNIFGHISARCQGIILGEKLLGKHVNEGTLMKTYFLQLLSFIYSMMISFNSIIRITVVLK